MRSGLDTSSSDRKLDLIQFLRALAITLVVLFHLDVLFPKGYLGVDIFFVISGFVITTSIQNEVWESNSFKVSKFIAKRVLRILPALSIMIIGSVILSFLTQTAIQPTGEQQVTAKTALSGLFFIANLTIPIFSSGYFGTLAHENSMTHLWSISIEFQFYLIFSILVWLLVKQRRHLKSFSIFSAVPVLFSFIYFITSAQEKVFFSLMARSWEFALGIFIALCFRVVSQLNILTTRRNRSFFILFGLFLIFVSQLEFLPLSSISSLMFALLGTTIIIFSSAGNSQRFLTSGYLGNFFVTTGNISYSLYLIHWPIFVMVLPLLPGNFYSKILLALVVYIFSFLSFKLIETRFLNRNIPTPKRLQKTFILFLCACVSAAGLGYGSKQNWGVDSFGLSNPFKPFTQDCTNLDLALPNCFFKNEDSEPLMMVVGDSQAGAGIEGFKKFGKLNGYSVLVISRNGGPFTDATCRSVDKCEDLMMDAIKEYNPKLLVVSNLWNLPLDQLYESSTLQETFIDPIQNWAESNSSRVIVMTPLPIVRNFGSYISLVNSEVLQEKYFQPIFVPSQNQISKLLLQHSTNSSTFRALDLNQIYCSSPGCLVIKNQKSIYRDKSHLSDAGALLLVPALQRATS